MIYVGIVLGVVIVTAIIVYVIMRKGKSMTKNNLHANSEKSVEDAGTLELNEFSSEGLQLTSEDFNLDEEDKSTQSVSEDDFMDDFMDDFDFGFDNSDFEGFDDVILGNESVKDEKKRSPIVQEIHEMSPKMKAIILADVLDRKHF